MNNIDIPIGSLWRDPKDGEIVLVIRKSDGVLAAYGFLAWSVFPTGDSRPWRDGPDGDRGGCGFGTVDAIEFKRFERLA